MFVRACVNRNTGYISKWKNPSDARCPAPTQTAQDSKVWANRVIPTMWKRDPLFLPRSPQPGMAPLKHKTPCTSPLCEFQPYEQQGYPPSLQLPSLIIITSHHRGWYLLYFLQSPGTPRQVLHSIITQDHWNKLRPTRQFPHMPQSLDHLQLDLW